MNERGNRVVWYVVWCVLGIVVVSLGCGGDTGTSLGGLSAHDAHLHLRVAGTGRG